MDLAILHQIASELQEVLPGGFVNKVHQPLPRDVVMRIRLSGGGEKKLMLSADPGMPRIHLTELKIPNPPSPPRFCAFLRAHFQGARIREIRAAEDDRVVRIMASRGPEGQRVERDLILELLGRDANILLVDRASNLIMDCLHRIPEKETGSRVVMPGFPYLPPPRRVGTVPPVLDRPASPKPAPGIAFGPEGKPKLVLNAQAPGDRLFPTMNQAADGFFSPRLQGAMLEVLRKEVAAPLRTRSRSLDRRYEKIQADAVRLTRLRTRQEEGELIKANLGLARKGMDRIDVQDWNTGQTRTIMLDPALGPVANMERIFKKSAKGKRGETKVRERLEQTAQERAALLDMLYFVEQAGSIEELERLSSDMQADRGKVRKEAPRKKPTPPLDRPSQLFHRFPLGADRDVLVGKSAAGNVHLLRHKARKGDLWLHVKDYPGAHVILPAQGKESPSPQDTDYAAALAVRFSRARGKAAVEVMVARVEDVESVRGGLTGQAKVRRYVTVRSDGLLAEHLQPAGD